MTAQSPAQYPPESPDAALRARMASEVPPRLLDHIDRVVAIADALARRHGLDVARARLMAQAHDVLRALPPAALLAEAERRAMAIDPVERDAPVILHGPLGALVLAERYGIADERVLFAVRWHTPGHPEYDGEAWAMFIADKVEPHKVERWPALQEVADLAQASLAAAALRYLDLRLEEAARDHVPVQPMATLTRNALLRRLGLATSTEA